MNKMQLTLSVLKCYVIYQLQSMTVLELVTDGVCQQRLKKGYLPITQFTDTHNTQSNFFLLTNAHKENYMPGLTTFLFFINQSKLCANIKIHSLLYVPE